MGDNLKERTLGALKWSITDRVAQQGIQFVAGIILARLLLPEDYGLLGIVMVFAAIAYTTVEGGLSAAIVRTHDLTDKHTNTVFYTNLCVSVFLYLLLFFTAPLIAKFYDEPRITSIARIIFVAILFNAFYLVPYALFGRAMDYKSLTKVNLISTLCSSTTGITLAYLGYGVWALVFQQLSYHFVRMIMFYLVSHWKPKLLFSYAILKEYWTFSIHLLSNNLIGVLFNNLYTFLIGKLYPIKQVGYYTQAYKMSDTVSFTFQAILSTAYNMFAQIHDQHERISRILGELTRRVSVISLPIMAFLIASADQLFFVLFGDKWLPAVPYFQLLCAAALFLPMHQINIHALNAMGNSKITFRIELIKRVLIIISVALTYKFGIIQLLTGFVIACYGGAFASIFFVKKFLGISFKQTLSFVYRGIIIAVCVWAAVFACPFIFTGVSQYLLFIIQACAALLTYLFFVWLLCRDMLTQAWEWVKSKRKK